MGPWWMTVNKLEADLRSLIEEVHSASAAHPHLSETPALAHAEAAVARASETVRRLKPPRPQPGDELLRRASEAVGRAEEAVQHARVIARIAARRGGLR
jgi:hypothetical protein